MLVAVDTFVLVKHGPVLGGAPDMVVVGTPDLPTLDGGAVFLADFAIQRPSRLECSFYIHQSPANRFINLMGEDGEKLFKTLPTCLSAYDFFNISSNTYVLRPKRAVQMDPFVDIVVKKPSGSVCRRIALHVTEETFPRVLHLPRRHHCQSHLEHHGGQLVFIHLLVLLLLRQSL